MWIKEECNATKEFSVKVVIIIRILDFSCIHSQYHVNSTKTAFSLFQRDSILRLNNIQATDSGTYVCLASIENDETTNYEALTIVLKVRTAPGTMTKLGVSLSTVLGVMMWEFSSNNSGGYPIKSFTAEFRKYVEDNETEWQRLDPQNIPSNVVSSHNRKQLMAR